MGTKNLVMHKTHIDSINLCFFAIDFVYENVLWALASLWVFFCNYVLSSMGLILTYIFRLQRKNEHLVALAPAEQTKRNQFEDYEIDGFTEELANLLFPKFEDFHITSEKEIEGETENSVLVEIDSDIQQDAEKREEREIDCYVYMHEDGKKGEGKTEGSVIMVESVSNVSEDVKKIDENETECSVFLECHSNFQQDSWKSIENVQEEEREGHVVMDTGSSAITSVCQVVPQKEIGGFDFEEEEEEEEEPMTFSFSFLQNYTRQNVCGNAFLGTGNIAKEEISEHNLKEGHVAKKEEEMGYNNSCEGFECESLKAIEDVKETQFSCDREEVSHVKAECKNEKEGSSYNGEEACKDRLEKNEEETKWEDGLDEKKYDENDEEELEWEHDELVEQIKMELRNARQGGLATILEEEEEDEEKESTKIVEELKPLSIEEKKMEYKDHIVEIQKVYRCYAEKIRKLDVLNYQAMHAIGLLQLKDPLKLKLTPKSTVQNAKPLVSQNLWPRKAPKHTSDPMLKLVHELHRDLELVYVGQVCLSWEILCWQHMKIQELKKYDSQRPYRYNLVAGEFQLFQVLMQRFIEDEPFQQDTRIQNYVKNRCVIRNLLQVPAIKGAQQKLTSTQLLHAHRKVLNRGCIVILDIAKNRDQMRLMRSQSQSHCGCEDIKNIDVLAQIMDKKKIKWGEEDAIASEMLAKIIEESMQVFWDFIRADKDYENVFNKVSHKNGNDVEDIEISDLLRDTQTQLQKKERKLKDKVRSGNCIVRKFQKHHEDKIQLDHEQLLAQVGLRLISRVINMKKLRKDQLVWCNEKLNRIKFVDRKIQVEPSFLLFPC